LLKQTISLSTRSSLSDGGIPAYGSAASASCRIDYKTTILRDTQGQEVASSARIYLSPSQALNLTDRVTMPDSSFREIIDLRLHYDAKGTLVFKEVLV
jgi:hypothetical protein